MKRDIHVDFGNLILSLSDALDMASPLLQHHQLRTAFIAWEISKTAKLDHELVETIFFAALLHDIGAMSVEEKLRIHESGESDVEAHCQRGEILLSKVPMLQDTAQVIRRHHRPWNEWDQPINDPVVLMSQIIMFADQLERMINRDGFILHQIQELTSKATGLANTTIHPQIVDLFILAANREEFWLDLVSPRIYSMLLNSGPHKRFDLDLNGIMSISEFLRNLVDFKSRFTTTHTSGVAACASILARIFGLSETEVQLIEVAGNLHDLGRLVIPNKIFEKPGKLSEAEFAIMKSHTYYTYSILNTVSGLELISEWAAFHHEKLDGSGYPFHCSARELNTGARIMAIADIFTALAEDRPYRKGMPKDEVEEVLNFFTKQNLLDGKIINLLKANYDEIYTHVMLCQADAKMLYATKLAFLDLHMD